MSTLASKTASKRIGLLCFLAAALASIFGQTGPQNSSQNAGVETLDKVIAVVNDQAILSSDLEEEMHLAVLDPGRAGKSELSPARALEQLISRALIEQEIRQEDARSADPSQQEVAARLNELRTELPACVRQNCRSDAGWKAFLDSHDLTPEHVETYLRYRLQILSFIELRFRQGIRISPEDIEKYYRETLLPQYPITETPPLLEQVSPRIQEILLQQQVTVLFGVWLENLRKQGEVEVLDPALESTDAPKTTVPPLDHGNAFPPMQGRVAHE